MAGSPIRPIVRPICHPIIRGINTLVGGTTGSSRTNFVLDGVTQLGSVVRAGNTATKFNSSGLLEIVAANVARDNHYDPVTLVKGGTLLEMAATNSCLRSDDLTDAAWVKTSCTAAKDAVGLTGGANSCSTLTATGANATCLQSFVHASSTRCGSLYLKRKTGSGTVEITVDNGTTWTPVAVDGTFRPFFRAQGTLTNGVFGIRIVTSGDEIYVDGCQYETPLGSSNWTPSSYIPTAGATATRAGDVLIDIPLAFGAEGTFFFEGYITAGNGASCTLFYPSDNTTSNRIVVARTGTKTIECDTYSGGVRQAIPTTTAITDGVKFKLAYGYKLNDFAVSLNGAAAVTDVLGAAPVAMSEIAIGNVLTGGTQLNGCILNSWFEPVRGTNIELAALSA